MVVSYLTNCRNYGIIYHIVNLDSAFIKNKMDLRIDLRRLEGRSKCSSC